METRRRGHTVVVAALTIDALSPDHEPHRSRIRLLIAASLVAFGVAAVAAGSSTVPDRRILEVGTNQAVAPAAPEGADAAVGSWASEHGGEVFPGLGTYVGGCGAAPVGTIGLCSTLSEDLGDAEIHIVGPANTDTGADVLVEQTDAGWQVTAVAPWPALGEVYDGSPWSPTTAITTWWRADERAPTMYGDGAVHLRTCDEAAAGPSDQPLLCSTLVEDTGTTRTYDSGHVGRPADVRVTVERLPDRTWTVTGSLAR